MYSLLLLQSRTIINTSQLNIVNGKTIWTENFDWGWMFHLVYTTVVRHIYSDNLVSSIHAIPVHCIVLLLACATVLLCHGSMGGCAELLMLLAAVLKHCQFSNQLIANIFVVLHCGQ